MSAGTRLGRGPRRATWLVALFALAGAVAVGHDASRPAGAVASRGGAVPAAAGIASAGTRASGAGSAQSVRSSGDLDSTCRAIVRGSVSDGWVGLGDELVVRTQILTSCPQQRRPYHVAFVSDASAARAAGPASMLADDIRAITTTVALEQNRLVRAGVTAFGERALVLCPPTRHPGVLADCLHRAADPAPDEAWGEGGLAEGVREGTKSLINARGAVEERESDDPLREGLVVLEGPTACGAAPCDPDVPACASAREEASAARALGIELSVVCLGGDCQAACLPAVADRAYPAYAWDAMTTRQATLAWQSELRVSHITLSEALHPSLVLDPGSVDYIAGEYDASEHGLTWRIDTRRRTNEPVLLSYSVTATQAGLWPVRLDAGGVLVDTDGLSGVFDVPRHKVRVAEGRLSHLFLPDARQPLPRPTPGTKPFGR